MNDAPVEVTSAMEAIVRREAGHKRLAKTFLPLMGIIMLGALAAGFHFAGLTPVRLAVLCLSGIFYLLSYSSLVCGQWTIGMIPQAGIGAYFFLLASLWPFMSASSIPWLRVLLFVFFFAGGCIVLFFLASITIMLLGSFTPRSRGQYTLMVLGCKLKNGRPGRMLRRRLDKAVSELNADRRLICAVSGGRAPDQPCAEAEAMLDYLVERGISPDRIIAETSSSTTCENFLFTKQLLSEAGLPERVGIVSDRFHQFRAGRIARTAGMDSFPVSCRTVWYLAVQFWMRDVLCILERLIRGHW